MPETKYANFVALYPFFEIIQKGLTGLVDGEHYFDTIADDAFFDFRYRFPGWPQTIRGRADLMAQFSGYGDNIRLHSADGLVVHHAQDRRVVILEYEVHGKILSSGAPYDKAHIGRHDQEQKDRPLAGLHGFSGRLDGIERRPITSTVAI
jgi:ketosteroid isomerase-like protein